MKMTRIASFSLLLLAAVSFADPAPATRPVRASVQANPFDSQFSSMVKALQLSADQQAKIKTLCEDLVTQTDSFRETVGKQVRDDQATAYTRNGDERTQLLKQLRESYVKSRETYNKLVSDCQARINAELHPEQRLAWERFKLFAATNQRFAALYLTEAQRAQVAALLD